MEKYFNNECNYIRIDPCETSNDVLIVFSHVGYPAGKFAMTHVLENIRSTKIFVNCHDNSWYQDGIKGVTPNIDETFKLLLELLLHLNPGKIICTGMSMGAYAAILFGLKLQCDAVVAFTPELLIGEEYSRSYYLNDLKKYDYRYIQLSNLMRTNKKTQIYSIYGAYDTIDLSFIWLIAEIFLEKKLFKAFFVSGDHTVTNRLDVNNIIKTLLKKGELDNQDIHQEYVLNQDPGLNELMVYKEIHRLKLKKDSESIYDLLKNQPHLKEFTQMALHFGDACIDLKHYDEGKDILNHAIEIDHNSDQLYHSLGIAYHFTNDLTKAKASYEKALEIRPHAVNTRHRIGSVEMSLKNYDIAEAHLKKAVELSPEFHEAYSVLGSLYLKKGIYEKSLSCYSNALKYGPQNEEYIQNIQKVKSLIKKNKMKKLKNRWKNKPKSFKRKLKTKIKLSIFI